MARDRDETVHLAFAAVVLDVRPLGAVPQVPAAGYDGLVQRERVSDVAVDPNGGQAYTWSRL